MKRREGATCLSSLPEGCLSEILSRTTPRDVCRLSATSSAFNAAVQSDAVWSTFLPSDVDDVVASAADPVVSLSRRELYFRICSSPLLLRNSLSFSLDKESGKKCYMIPSTILYNATGETPKQWKWSNSTLIFPKGKRIGLIQGKINSSLLSINTSYSAYLIFKVLESSVDYYPISVAVNYVEKCVTKLENTAYLTAEMPLFVPLPIFWCFPQLRDDGWMEVRMGNFYNEGVDEEVELVVKSYKALVSTLFVQGFELRPTEED